MSKKPLIERIWNFFTDISFKVKVSSSPISSEFKQLQKIHEETKKVYSSLHKITPDDVAFYIFEEVKKETKRQYPKFLIDSIYDMVLELGSEDGLFGVDRLILNANCPISEQIFIKEKLYLFQEHYNDFDNRFGTFLVILIESLINLLKSLPILKQDNKKQQIFFDANALDLIDNVNHNIQVFIESFCSKEAYTNKLFISLQEQLEYNVEKNNDVLPKDSPLDKKELISSYLAYTPFLEIFNTDYRFSIPLQQRFEHTHILASTGYGKTQLLQHLILHDLHFGNGLLLIDSQKDLISKISSLKIFTDNQELKEKLVIVDVEDIEFPPCLNIFDLNTDKNISLLDKERQINKTVDLYTYIFDALFGQELTAKQEIVFKYLARLIFEIPNANIQTLRDILQNSSKYKKYFDALEGSAKYFFKEEFMSSTFASTKKQVLSRLYSVLSSLTLERILSNKENKLDLFDCMNKGKIVLVNTSKDLLGEDGSSILGRYFISLVSQAVFKRASLLEEKRKPFFVYIDEASEYIDNKISSMLEQARKYKVGFVLAHQSLEQLGSIKNTVLSNTSIKFTGSVSYSDIKIMKDEMKTSIDKLQALKKYDNYCYFSCFVKNKTSNAVNIKVNFGILESLKKMTLKEKEQLQARNRDLYCNRITNNLINDTEIEDKDIVESVPLTKDNESPQSQNELKSKAEMFLFSEKISEHKRLQNSIKKISQKLGFYSVIEKKVLDNTGSVDVSLDGYDLKIAFEVSITTNDKNESSNIDKCFKASYDKVVLVSNSKNHLDKLKMKLEDKYKDYISTNRLFFLTEEEIPLFLDNVRLSSKNTKTNNIKGYKVKLNYVPSSLEEQELKKETIAKIILEN